MAVAVGLCWPLVIDPDPSVKLLLFVVMVVHERVPVVLIFVLPNDPMVKVPVLMFDALRFGILAVASTPVLKSAAEPLVATVAKPLTAAAPTELAGRLTVPVAVRFVHVWAPEVRAPEKFPVPFTSSLDAGVDVQIPKLPLPQALKV